MGDLHCNTKTFSLLEPQFEALPKIAIVPADRDVTAFCISRRNHNTTASRALAIRALCWDGKHFARLSSLTTKHPALFRREQYHHIDQQRSRIRRRSKAELTACHPRQQNILLSPKRNNTTASTSNMADHVVGPKVSLPWLLLCETVRY